MRNANNTPNDTTSVNSNSAISSSSNDGNYYDAYDSVHTPINPCENTEVSPYEESTEV